MRLRYLPRLTIDRDSLSTAVGKRVPAGDGPLRMTDVDEDEATMAVEAARALLARAGLTPDDVAALRLQGTDEPRHAQILGAAVVGDPARGHLADDASDPEDEGVHVGVTVQVVRPSAPALFQGATAFADAFLEGSEEAEPVPYEPSAPHELPADPDRLDVLARAQADAPAGTVPMGAYVPEGTWAASERVRYRPQLGVCADGHAHFPPRPACPVCDAATERTPAPRKGRIHTYAVIAAGGGPTEFDFLQRAWGSYASLAVEPEGIEGVRIPALATDVDPDDLSIGQAVEAVFRRIYAMEGSWRYGTKFRPDRES